MGIVAFYLQDAAMLLYHDEMLVVGDGTRWRFRADAGSRWSGRYLAFPNLLRPDLLLFRAPWRDAPAPVAAEAAALRAFAGALVPVRAGCLALLLLWLLAVPVLLFQLPGSPALLGTAAAGYLLAAILCAWLWHRRSALGLRPRDVAAIAAEAMLCPPFAIQLVRKACLRRGLKGDPLALAVDMPVGERRALATAIEGRINTAIAFAPDGDPVADAYATRRTEVAEALQ